MPSATTSPPSGPSPAQPPQPCWPDANGTEGEGDALVNSTLALMANDDSRGTIIIALAIVRLVLAVFGCVTNIIAAVVLTNRKLWSPTSMLLLSLVIYDAFYLLLVIPVGASSISVNIHFTADRYSMMRTIFTLCFPLRNMAQMASTYTTLTVTVERYLVILLPLKASSMWTYGKTRRAVIGVLLFSVLFNVPRCFDHILSQPQASSTPPGGSHLSTAADEGGLPNVDERDPAFLSSSSSSSLLSSSSSSSSPTSSFLSALMNTSSEQTGARSTAGNVSCLDAAGLITHGEPALGLRGANGSRSSRQGQHQQAGRNSPEEVARNGTPGQDLKTTARNGTRRDGDMNDDQEAGDYTRDGEDAEDGTAGPEDSGREGEGEASSEGGVPESLHYFYRVIYSFYLTVIFLYLIPYTLIPVLNLQLVMALRKRREETRRISVKNEHRLNGSGAVSSPTDKEEGLTYIVFGITFCYFICCILPAAYMISAIASDTSSDQTSIFILNAGETTLVINAATDFFFYCLLGRKFRRVFVRTFCPKRYIEKTKTMTLRSTASYNSV